MGGFGYDICGGLARGRVDPSEEQPSFFGRLLGRKGITWPKVYESPRGWKHFEVQAADLERSITQDFSDYLNAKIKNSWESTRFLKSYLAMRVQHLYVRGEQPPKETTPKWRVQISFSDCAGTAGVLAQLASHWTDLWYIENQQRINHEVLIPWGFTPQTEPEFPNLIFFPFGDLGYALYNEQPQTIEINEDKVLTHFEPDGSTIEILMENRNPNWLRDIEAAYAPLMADKRCRCQLCMPDFVPPALPEIQ